MNRLPRRSSFPTLLKLASAAWLAGLGIANALTWHFGYVYNDDGNGPAKMAQITTVMNEAVAVYNSTTNINVDINVAYHPGVPTAQSDYNGELKFGGSISTQVAIHEIAHYLGSGTYWSWWNNFDGGGVWTGPALRRYIKLFDGPGAEIRKSDPHYYPYGFNYGSEDSPIARYRIGRIIQAMRQDMGITNGDGNGISDEWERQKMGVSGQPAAGDSDGDGISNYDEYWTDSHPMWACPVRNGRIYQIRSRLSQKLLEVANTTAGAAMRQNPNNGSDLQKWVATYVSGGYWKFTNVASGKCPDVVNFSGDAGAAIIAWNDTGGTNQQWRIFPGASGGAVYWKMGNRNSTNMVMDVIGGPNATGDNAGMNQYTDDLNALNQEWAFDDVTPGAQNDGLVANYKLEGNARDHSSHGFQGTSSGGITYAAGRVDGLAATFNGTNGSIEVPATVDRNFTLACWMKTIATAGGAQWYNGMGLVDAEVPGVARDFGLALVQNKAAFGVGAADITITSANAVNDGQWHHIAATLDTATGAMKLYVDSVLSATGTAPTGARTAPGKFRLGSIGGATGFLNGSLDEVRIYNKILGAAEISRLASVGNTLVASYPFEGNVRDASPFGGHGDDASISYGAGRVGANAIQFSGANSFAKIPASVTNDFTVAYWVNTTGIGGVGQWWAGKSMVDADIPGVANDWGIALVGDKAGFGVGNTGNGTTILSTTPINDGTWHHVTATRVNATGEMKLYVDGALQATGTGSTAVRDGPGGIRLGSTLFGGSYFTGAIDDLKIFNYALSVSQVASLSAPLPSPWTSADIGNPGSDGYAGYSATAGGTFTVVGGGLDIAGAGDQFQFVSAPAIGNQVAVTRVVSVPANSSGTPQANSKGGLMFRNSTAADAPFVGVIHDHGPGLRFMYRDTTGATASQVGGSVAISGSFWLKLMRAGNSFTASYATTPGIPAEGDWISLGSRDTTLSSASLAGVVVCSKNTSQVATATYSNLSITPLTPGDTWRQQNFASTLNTGNAADSADPDGDGFNNLLERALALNPNVADAVTGQPLSGKDQDFVSLTYQKNLSATDLQYQVIWSNDLTTWSTTDVIDTVTGTTPTTETHQAKVPLTTVGPSGGFLRLRVR